MRALSGAAAFAAALAVSRAAAPQASSPSPQTNASICGCAGSAPGDRLHDGFFARSEASLAFLWANVRGANVPLGRTGIRAIGQGGSISIGATPERGWVVGGSAWAARLDPEFVE